jgi:two-component system, NtrC family, nitrogen regulation sensor histidine kinase NtrY
MRQGVPLRIKLTVALVLIVMVPLGLAAFLFNSLGTITASVAAGDAAARISTMDKAIGAYHDLVETTKRLHSEIADRLSKRPAILALDPSVDLEKVLVEEPGLRAIDVIRADKVVVAHADHPLAPDDEQWRDKVVEQPLGTTGATLKLTFIVSKTLQSEIQELKSAIDGARQVAMIRTTLPDSYRNGFVALLAAAGLLAIGFGFWASRSATSRIAKLVDTARSVSAGRVDARAQLPGRGNDEMAELASAFNTMLDHIEDSRQQVEYLQRMGVWQDVARRLAHEIKNPLTPIQLAVQQCVSSYKGDDAKYRKLLTDTGEIVEEEIEGLRRLVDTFRTLGALPKVEKAPIALAEAVEELKLDPQMAQRLVIEPPLVPVTVRADKLLLKRVLANLVENGIHAGQEAGGDGTVVVGWSTDPRGEAVTITVDDAGKGVKPENRDKIFEPYVTTKATGTGLGLAIARKIAIEHGGELRLAAEKAPTGGARFVVSLPLRGPEQSLA